MTIKAWVAVLAIGTAIAVVTAAGATPMVQGAQANPTAKTTATAKAKPAPVKLPATVEAAFKKAYPQATIKSVAHETEGGQEQYEIESVDHGRALDVNYKPDGTVIVIEQEVTAADVPGAVMAAITARYPKATVTRRERATEDKKVYFELGVTGAPVKEVQLTPEGKWISPKPSK
jgi:hypothetical protein